MCGIVGIIGRFEGSKGKMVLEELKERGPDDTFSKHGDNYFLGLSRLSIIAPDDEELPYTNESNDIFCVVNGEIYNHIELRSELFRKGHQFKTLIDTEVVLHAYEEYGQNFIYKLNGIFAIVIYDQRRNILFAARDHLGIKPLYYTKKDNCYYFCSLAKPLATILYPRSEINYKSLIKLLYRQSIPEPDTIFSGIYSIPAGNFGIVKQNQIYIQRYFKIQSNIIHEEPHVNDFCNLLNQVVSSQSNSDTNKISLALSEGVDSMLLGKLLKIESLIGYYLPYNPSRFEYGNQHCFDFKIITLDYLKYADKAFFKWITLSDQPPLDGFNTFLLSYGIRSNTKVLFSGLGADELFCGYPQFNKLFSIGSKDELIDHFLMYTNFFPEEWLKKLSLNFGYDFLEIKNEIKVSIYKETSEEVRNGNLLRELLIRYYLITCLLRDSDQNSMSNGIELRVPYLDLKILEYSLSHNYNAFFMNNENKYIIKQALSNRLGYTYTKMKEGFTLNYVKLMNNTNKVFPNDNQLNGYRNWCINNVKEWFNRNKYENCDFNSKCLL